jgi:hypothetical protein
MDALQAADPMPMAFEAVDPVAEARWSDPPLFRTGAARRTGINCGAWSNGGAMRLDLAGRMALYYVVSGLISSGASFPYPVEKLRVDRIGAV